MKRWGWVGISWLVACAKATTPLDGGALDTGAFDLGFADSGAFDGGLDGGRDAAPDLGVEADAGQAPDGGPGPDSGPGPDAGYQRCLAGATGLDGLLSGMLYQASVSQGRTGQGSARMGDTSLARWFGSGFIYLSSASPLGDVAQPASAIVAVPPVDSSTTALFYCPTSATARFYDAQPNDARLEAALLGLTPLGRCGQGVATGEALTLCVGAIGSSACAAPNGMPRLNWLEGQLGGEDLDEPLEATGLREVQGRYFGLFRSGRLALFLDATQQGYVVMRGPSALDPARVYCVQATLEGNLPLVVIQVYGVRTLGSCGAVGPVGELSLCSE